MFGLRKEILVYLVAILFVLFGSHAWASTQNMTAQSLEIPSTCGWAGTIQLIKCDYNHYYSKRNLFGLGLGVAVSSIFANSDLDQNIVNWYQNRVRSHTTNTISNLLTPLGPQIFPLYIGTALIGGAMVRAHKSETLYVWSMNTIRSFVVGVPPALLLQATLGPTRPSSPSPHSDWKWFHGNQYVGLSGHAFAGAIPFLVAADMSESKVVRYGLYVASTLVGLARINDNQHYFSQVFLGWWVANSAVKVVMRPSYRQKVSVSPMLVPNGVGLCFSIKT